MPSASLVNRLRDATARAQTAYMHIHFWPGSTAVIAGLMAPVKSARLLATGQEVKFEQDRLRVRFLNLPANAPDSPVTTIAVECGSEPKQDNEFVRRERDCLQV